MGNVTAAVVEWLTENARDENNTCTLICSSRLAFTIQDDLENTYYGTLRVLDRLPLRET